jgi:negative regulator of genetic competence, sporulation and motility
MFDLLRRSHLVSSHYVKYLISFSSLESIVRLSTVIKIEISFDPLAKF